MNAYESAELHKEVEKTPISFVNGFHLWIIIGCSIASVLIIIIFISVYVHLRRRRLNIYKLKDESDFNRDLDIERRDRHSCSFSSTPSEDSPTSDSNSTQDGYKPKYCVHNNTGLPSIISECIQPKNPNDKWYSAFRPKCQATTTIFGALEANSDEQHMSDDESTADNTCPNGRLGFSIAFQPEEEELKIFLYKAKHLPGRGLTNALRDPFVKIFLLPDEENSYQSKIRKRSLNPKFNEIFTFKVNKEELTQRSVRFSLYDVDKRKIRHNLGHVIFPLSQMEHLDGHIIWKDLDSNAQKITTLGEIQVSLGYNPYTSKIKVVVGNVRNIQGITANDISMYIKVQLYHGHKLMKSKKTGPQSFKLTTNQKELLFGETFNFGVSGRFFDSCSFTFTLMLTGVVSCLKDTPHGRIVIGPFMYARGDSLQHWQDMLTNTRTMVTKWHNLEPVASD